MLSFLKVFDIMIEVNGEKSIIRNYNDWELLRLMFPSNLS